MISNKVLHSLGSSLKMCRLSCSGSLWRHVKGRGEQADMLYSSYLLRISTPPPPTPTQPKKKNGLIQIYPNYRQHFYMRTRCDRSTTATRCDRPARDKVHLKFWSEPASLAKLAERGRVAALDIRLMIWRWVSNPNISIERQRWAGVIKSNIFIWVSSGHPQVSARHYPP